MKLLNQLMSEKKAHMLRAELAMILFCLFAVLSQNVRQSDLAISQSEDGPGNSTQRYEPLLIKSDIATFDGQQFSSAQQLADYLLKQQHMFVKIEADDIPLSTLRQQWLQPLAEQQIGIAL